MMVPLKSKPVRAIIGCILRAWSFKTNGKNTKIGISDRQNIFGFTIFSNSHLKKHALGSNGIQVQRLGLQALRYALALGR